MKERKKSKSGHTSFEGKDPTAPKPDVSMPDTPYIPIADKLEGDRLFNSPIPMRLESRDGVLYPGFCRAPVAETDTDVPAPIDDSEMYGECFDRLSEIPSIYRRTDGG
jgi:hypothetical protein